MVDLRQQEEIFTPNVTLQHIVESLNGTISRALEYGDSLIKVELDGVTYQAESNTKILILMLDSLLASNEILKNQIVDTLMTSKVV
jgi:hypothetical protein